MIWDYVPLSVYDYKTGDPNWTGNCFILKDFNSILYLLHEVKTYLRISDLHRIWNRTTKIPENG